MQMLQLGVGVILAGLAAGMLPIPRCAFARAPMFTKVSGTKVVLAALQAMPNPVLTVPNLLTASRLALAPVVVGLLAEGDVKTACWVFAVAGLTDLLDGTIARLFNQRSIFGAWLDPIADKVLLLSTLFALAVTGILPLWLAVIVAIRDLVVLAGAMAYRFLTGGLEVAPTLLGKTATFCEFFLAAFALADAALAWEVGNALPGLVMLTALLVGASGLQYVWLWADRTRRYLRRRNREGHEPVA
jgi:cardiolipin synthase